MSQLEIIPLIRLLFRAQLDKTGYPAYDRSLEIYDKDNQRCYTYHYIGQSDLTRYDSDPNFVYFDFGNHDYQFVVAYHCKQPTTSYLLVKRYCNQSVNHRHWLQEGLFELDILQL